MVNVVRPYKFTFSSNRWYLNLLCTLVGLIIPIVGQIVIIGYAFQQIERWHRRKDDSNYEDFKLTGDGLLSYLTGGCWPFFVQFLIQQCPMMTLAFAFNIYVMSMMRPGQPPDLSRLGVAYGVFYPSFFALSLVLSFILMPMMLRSGLMQDFKAGFSLPFIGDFIRRVWGSMLLVLLMQFVVGLSMLVLISFPFSLGVVLLLLGYNKVLGICLIVGGILLAIILFFLAAPIVALAGYHFLHQLYETYLERGGTPVPLKEPPAPKVTPPVVYA